MDRARARRKDQGVEPACDQAQRLESALPVILAGVFDHQGAIPFKFVCKLERDAARGDVVDVIGYGSPRDVIETRLRALVGAPAT